MKSLFIDTHLYDIKILLFVDNKIEYEVNVTGQKYNSTFLMPSIKEVCDKFEFDEIVIVNGPGSFTGIRLGVTVAKTLAYTMNKPIKVLGAFDLFAFSCDNMKHTFGMSDGNGYFIGKYQNYTLTEDLFYLNKSDYNNYLLKNNVETDVIIDYKKVAQRFPNIETVNPHSVKPIYIKTIGVENDKINNK